MNIEEIPAPTLEEAQNQAGCQTAVYMTGGGKGREPKTNYIAWEHGDTTVVHSYDREALVQCLLGWANVRWKGITLVEFAGSRGFNFKCIPQED